MINEDRGGKGKHLSSTEQMCSRSIWKTRSGILSRSGFAPRTGTVVDWLPIVLLHNLKNVFHVLIFFQCLVFSAYLLSRPRTAELLSSIDYNLSLASLERAQGTTLKSRHIRLEDLTEAR
jgi:hypothetical protein